MQRHHAHRNRNKFRRRPTPPVVQSLVAGAQVHPRAAAVLCAVFVADERACTGARCELSTGEVVGVKGRKTPFFALCRELDKGGYGDCRIEISTPEGTPSLRGKVSALAGLRIEESDKDGLRLRAYRPFSPGRVGKEGDLRPKGTQAPENEEMRASDSTVHEKAA